MALRLIWSPRAVDNLADICDFIAEDSPEDARRFAARVMAYIESFPAFPNAGRIVAKYNDPAYRERMFHEYRIVYRVHPDVLEIIAISHGSRNLPPMPQ